MTLPITQAQYELLDVLSQQPYNLSQAARILGKARSTVTLTSHTLDEKGWVEEVEIESNGRYLTTTRKGDIVVEAVTKL
jgi:DNA-binding MarR family transcriptional regulator